MHTSYFRYLYNLLGSKITPFALVALLLGSFSQETIAQGKGYVRKHLEFYDDKPIHFGFFFGMPIARYNTVKSDAFASDTTVAIHSKNATAFRMGFTINRTLNSRFDLRTTPAVTLYDRELTYNGPNGKKNKVRESTWIEVPLLVKYKSVRRVNHRMYLIAGTTFGFETNVKNRVKFGDEQLNIRKSDITLDYGVGFERFFEFFKLTPELRFSHGLLNMINKNNSSLHTPGLKKINTHTVTLLLNFE